MSPLDEGPLLVGLARCLFPPGSFPDEVYLHAADEALRLSWVRRALRQEVDGPRGAVDDVHARLAQSPQGTLLLTALAAAAMHAALDTARSERVAVGRLDPPA